MADSRWIWCSRCGDLWKPTDWCKCPPSFLRPFPNNDIVNTLRRIAGNDAVWELEKQLFLELVENRHDTK